MVTQTKKMCSRCKQEKELKHFGNLKKSTDGKRYDCFECRKKIYYETFEKQQAIRRNYYKNNKEIIKKKVRSYWNGIPRWRRKIICTVRNKKRKQYLYTVKREWQRKNISTAGDAYIRSLIRYDCGDIVKVKDIPKELIELYRLNLTLKRLKKEKAKCWKALKQ